MIKLIYVQEMMEDGRTESSLKPDLIYQRLRDSHDWTDHLYFESSEGRYNLQDLEGKVVLIEGHPMFLVNDDGITYWDGDDEDNGGSSVN